MARKNTRVVLNRSRLDEVRLALADGVLAVATEMVNRANPPDATPFGVGLVTSGGAAVWVDRKKVGDFSDDGTAVRKPRSLKLLPAGITGIAGFGFPGRFQEMGTVHHGAQPFLTPAGMDVAGEADAIMASVVGPKLGHKP